MQSIAFNIIGFTACAAIIVYSGRKLSIYGDRISDLTGMGKAWVGLILMASVTSLPELIIGISSVSFVKAPDLAVGDVYGSCVFNLLILSILDLQLKKPLFSLVKPNHIVASIFGTILTSISGLGMYFAYDFPELYWISHFSLLLMVAYFISIWGIFSYDKANGQIASDQISSQDTIPTHSTALGLRNAIIGYALHAIIVVATAMLLPAFGKNIATYTGLGDSFFGTLFIASTTSLPELVVSLTAIRMGSTDIAVGNLLGSNIFNMFILGIDDIFYTEGSLFKAISPSHMLSVFIIIIMTSVVGLSLMFKPKKKQLWIMGIDAFFIMILYMTLMIYLFITR